MGSMANKDGVCPEPDEGEWAIEIEQSPRATMKQGSCEAYLTWENVGVAVSGTGKGRSKSLLSDATGYAKPGEVLAIMGPSGCGKSTLLDSLAGRLASNTRHTGRVLINGRKQRLTHGTMAYMTQEQVLTWTLTVKETVYYSAELQLPKLMPKSEKMEIADKTIREMGLQDSVNTRIGGWGIKGLSGGQKRRVRICLELLTHPKILLLDEPMSGLDSAASYYIMKHIIKLTQQYRMTVLTAIHQPSSEIYGLFNNLCLLSLGKTVYFGPPFAANQFFAENGFPCPNVLCPADHCLRTINTDFDEEIGGRKTPVEHVINVLAESYKSSEIYMEVQNKIATICSQKGGLIDRKGCMQASFITQCLVLSERSFINMYRDLGYYWLRLGINMALGFALGTLFYKIGTEYDSINARVSMIMFVSSTLTMLAIGGFPSFMEEMKVFEWERLNGHYGVGAFVISNAISSMPYLFFNSLFPGAIAYSLMGLQRKHEQFIYFTLVLFVSMALVEGLMMMVAAVVTNLLMAIICGVGIQGLMILGAGFFRFPNDLPHFFWKYPMYYISFHKYSLQGLYKNEFEGIKFHASSGGPLMIDGEMILKDVLHIEMGYSKWIDLLILFGMLFVYRVILFCAIKTIERVKLIPRTFLLASAFRK